MANVIPYAAAVSASLSPQGLQESSGGPGSGHVTPLLQAFSNGNGSAGGKQQEIRLIISPLKNWDSRLLFNKPGGAAAGGTTIRSS